MSTLPTHSKSLTRHPPSPTLSLTSLPLPSASPPYHLIRTHATTLTSGELTWPEPLSLPTSIPGFDLAGTVVVAPPDSPFQPGEKVYALTSFSRQGNAREYSVALTEELATMPRGVTWEEAASVPLSALSAWQALFVHAGLSAPGKEGGESAGRKRVLVTAAAGGVGVWAVQLARAAGAEVVGTCGAANGEFVRGLGADEVLDYKVTDLKEWVGAEEGRRFDVTLDCVGGKTLEDAWTCVKDGGVVISVAQPPETMKPTEGIRTDVRSVWFIVESNGQQLGEIKRLVEDGKCKGVVDSVWEIENWEKALERLKGGHTRGKVVLKLAE
ncbi:alcohol dehydrogenase [Cenococcum geophilum 1.58]|uniref:alcohol dehydrogenase n=1 Tax=Cenococcum geophilum 1.58 TaxID=794803 RepID=UPI00358F8151|nr:alcohol dehydrogenase [Cenococcum geophilum 1.58]